MSNSKKKFIEYSIGFAVSVAASYFVIYVQINDLFAWPTYVYNTLIVFIGVLLVIFLFSFAKFLIVNYRDSKQTPYPSIAVFGGRRSPDRYVTHDWIFDGLLWKVEYAIQRGKVYEISGPYCPKEECETELNVKKTSFGRHKYDCPACSFKRTMTKNSYTVESNLEKVSQAKLEREYRAQ